MSDQGKCPRCDAPKVAGVESGARSYTCGSLYEDEEGGRFGETVKFRQSQACSWHPTWIRRKKQFGTKETND